MSFITPQAKDVRNKTVIVRVDFNVPLDGERVVDDQRIRAALETILFLREHQAKIILISHLGRPDGMRVAKYSLAPVANYLNNNLKLPTYFVDNCIGEQVSNACKKMQSGEMLLLENLRFHPEEEANDAKFAKQLVANTGAEVFINEAFSASHRKHASVVGLSQLLPHFAGFDLAAEVKILQKMMEKTARPFITVLGGAKIDDKVEAVEALVKVSDLVLVGGGVANAFLKASGMEIHKSFIGKNTEANLAMAKKILSSDGLERTMLKSASYPQGLPLPKVVLPIDMLAAQNADVNKIENTQMIELLKDVADQPTDLDLQYLDLGPATIKLYKYLLSQAKTIFWNGPLGVFENPLFAKASNSIAKHIAMLSTDHGVMSVCGGGETGAVVNTNGLHNRFAHVSTAGGAALEFIGGKELPGLTALRK
jgi:3-phosphoglycerate kinase